MSVSYVSLSAVYQWWLNVFVDDGRPCSDLRSLGAVDGAFA